MESSQITGDDGEECSSNESGWTIYLASPMRSDDVKENGSEGSNVEDGSGYINERRKGKEDHNQDDDGDYDSLASDASTGPAQVKALEGKEEKNRQTNVGCSDEQGKDEQDEIRTKILTTCNKKAGKIKKGDEKTSRRGHSKRRSSSRTSFFW
ncbi:uncharacterized protein LOC112268774 [Brachypodium distachyon]|uniref:Uncharacterized protein n=1 Tax=Brachypodium distachyon TaxID=15368 RepID=A0A0Q3ESY4_BRADI|nr:uncharacterized protein LOC112268774 [Brachypodium distachyon]KQJ90623.1 hypothetical protein BRADI_4g32890v3 [Brachypodium distachyon]|eukprot:XP_024310643.1 uncharacterized protein LOC112268774 [Brachypodium distachyon]